VYLVRGMCVQFVVCSNRNNSINGGLMYKKKNSICWDMRKKVRLQSSNQIVRGSHPVDIILVA
jgi:hypothetical protein